MTPELLSNVTTCRLTNHEHLMSVSLPLSLSSASFPRSQHLRAEVAAHDNGPIVALFARDSLAEYCLTFVYC